MTQSFDDDPQSLDGDSSQSAQEFRDQGVTDAPSLDATRDIPGEALASTLADEADAVEYTVVDPEAEELTTADQDPDPASGIDDPAQLDDATATARAARSSRPVRRSQPLAVPDEPEPEPGAVDATSRSSSSSSRSARPVRRTQALPPVEEVDEGDAVGAAAGAGSSGSSAVPRVTRTARPVRRSELAVPEPDAANRRRGRTKSAATPQQAASTAVATRDHHRSTPAEFTRQSVGELRKVVWPTGDQLVRYFLVVLLFVLFIIAFVGGLDVFFGWLLLKLLGSN